MIKVYYLLIGFCFVLTINIYAQQLDDRDVLFQTSTIDALMEGVYDGDVTFGELKKHGDLGIGTFNGLDGEMVGLDNEFYQVKTDGKAYFVCDDTKTPFSVVTFFDADKLADLDKIDSLKQLEEHLDSILSNKNIFYAIRIDGVFKYVKTRSVPRQSKPYPPLAEVVKEQTVFEFEDVAGSIVGFFCPAYAKGVNVVGYHLHFITADKSSGGHMLDCKFQDLVAQIDDSSNFFMVLPQVSEFAEADLTKDKEKELKEIER
jgi:acetolactate decarboxylase